MRRYTYRELRSAVVLAVLLTALAVVALLDPSCHRQSEGPHAGPTRSILPR